MLKKFLLVPALGVALMAAIVGLSSGASSAQAAQPSCGGSPAPCSTVVTTTDGGGPIVTVLGLISMQGRIKANKGTLTLQINNQSLGPLPIGAATISDADGNSVQYFGLPGCHDTTLAASPPVRKCTATAAFVKGQTYTIHLFDILSTSKAGTQANIDDIIIHVLAN